MVNAAILTGFGINADVELGQAFTDAGARSTPLHVTRLIEDPSALDAFQILGFPGGFSFGDHLGSGRVLANLIRSRLKPALQAFTARGGLVLGVCNGFQVLVKMGLLPDTQGDWTPEASLVPNESGVFTDRWVPVAYPASRCVWTQGLGEGDLPIRHGEGRFLPADEALGRRLVAAGQVAVTYRQNPNGSWGDVAGLCDPTGRIFGLMPHPEAFTYREQHPLWRRRSELGPLGLKIFQNAVNAVKA